MAAQDQQTIRGRSFHIVTLGCSKNRVDSDGMDALLRGRGMAQAGGPDQADVVIVNTCGFLGAARDESVGAIQELLDQKRSGQFVIAAGCMPALGDFADAIPSDVDGILTTREWFRIGDVIGDLYGLQPEPEVAGCEGMLTTFNPVLAGPSAYVKVADGCDHNCAFCTIPSIKGRQESKRPAHVLQEVVNLVSRGTREIVLVAQDTIRYGADLGVKHGLPTLLETLAEQVPDLPWIRLLYIYPSPLTLKLVDTMAAYPSVLNYLDMPLQHADADVLRRMNRPSDPVMTRRLIDHARNSLDEVAMRTTFIVGYPGETEQQFMTLLKFVESEEFDHVGVFTYSPEEGTPAAALDGAIPAEESERRRAAIMEAQQTISLRKNQALVGQVLPVLIEAVGESEDDLGRTEPISVGRLWRHAPEVDGMVFVPGAHPTGSFVETRIAGASAYDLWAEGVTAPVAHGGAERARRRPDRVRRSPRRAGRPVPMARPAGT